MQAVKNAYVSGPYVAPFPQPSPSPPIYHGGAGGYQGHFMVYQPPLHLSMYPQYPQHHLDQEAGAGGPPVQVTKDPKAQRISHNSMSLSF